MCHSALKNPTPAVCACARKSISNIWLFPHAQRGTRALHLVGYDFYCTVSLAASPTVWLVSLRARRSKGRPCGPARAGFQRKPGRQALRGNATLKKVLSDGEAAAEKADRNSSETATLHDPIDNACPRRDCSHDGRHVVRRAAQHATVYSHKPRT